MGAVRGVFESQAGGQVYRRESWTLETSAAGSALRCEGAEPTGRGRTFKLDAKFGPVGDLEVLDFQVALTPPPTEVTTFALRVYGGRAYGSVIPPGGIPEKLETVADPGFAVRGFSTALDGLLAAQSGLKVGHGRRMVVIALDTPDARPRIRDGMLLCKSRSRAKAPTREEWCNTYEFRWAESAGRPDATLLVTRNGAVLSAEQSHGPAPFTTQLVEFFP